MTYNDIKSVNEKMKFTTVQKKPYAEVPQRVQGFRMLYPDGFIITEMLSNDNGVCVFKATAGYYDEKGEPHTLGTGTAYEREGSSFINKTSYIENCETSAVGRALGFLGIGSESSIASAEEVANAINNQGEKKLELTPASEPLPPWNPEEAIRSYCKRKGFKLAEFGKMREALITAGIVREIPTADLNKDQLDELVLAIEANFSEVKGAKA